MDHTRRTRASGLLSGLVIVFTTLTVLFVINGCARSAVSRIAVTPLTAETYLSIAADATPKAAYLRQVAAERNTTLDAARVADEALSLEQNPFSYKDAQAVRNGGIIYAAHCASCHGADASGSGPAMSEGTSKMSFHNSHKRMYIKLTGHAPRNWAPAVFNGQVSSKTTSEGRSLTMPAFADTLAREQIWLAVTYLEHVTLHPQASSDKP